MIKADKRCRCDYNIEPIVRNSDLGKKNYAAKLDQDKFSICLCTEGKRKDYAY